MYTLLPEQKVADLQKEYRIRVIILALFFLSGAVWIGISSLLPSYIIAVIQEQNAENSLSRIKQTTQTPVNASVAATVSTSNAQIKLVKNSEDPVVFSGIIENIANRRTPGILINDIEIAHASADVRVTATNLSIRGVASTRDALVAFQSALAADPEFSKVDLPVSDLARSTDLTFSLNVTTLH